MKTNGRMQVLAIGPATFADAVQRALPRCDVTISDSGLGGLWNAGHGEFHAAIVSTLIGARISRLIGALRRVMPHQPVLVAVSPTDEPDARRLLQSGATQYILDPIDTEELQRALGLASAANGGSSRDEPAPTHDEVVALSDLLRGLADGATKTIERLAAIVRDACRAQGVVIELDDLVVGAGLPEPVVLSEPVHRDGATIGRIALARRVSGAYSAGDASKLSTYARLAESIVAQIRDRDHWRELAMRDGLTGLRNTRYLEAHVDGLLAGARESRQVVTMVRIRVDGLAAFLAERGREAADTALREIADLLERTTRQRDIVACLGEDDFLLLLIGGDAPRVAGAQHPRDATAFLPRFAAALERGAYRCIGRSADAWLRLRLALVAFPWDAATRAALLAAAESALVQSAGDPRHVIPLTGANAGCAETASTADTPDD